jgi:hypothetical protein
MAKAAKEQKDGWKFPIKGATVGRRRHQVERYFRLYLKFGMGEDCVLSGIPDFLKKLEHLLGDHEVQLSAGDLHPKAWDTDLPWKRMQYGHNLDLPIRRLANASIWQRVERCIDGAFSSLGAHRGGGAARHLVWWLQYDIPNEACDGDITLLLTERMFRDPLSSEMRALTCAFFSLGNPNLERRFGCGELVYLDNAASKIGWSVESWAYENFVNVALEEEKHQVPGVRWITFLTAEQLRRLGGFQRLRTSATELAAIGVLHLANTKYSEHPVERIHIEPLGDGAAVFLAPIDLTLNGMWFLDGNCTTEMEMGGLANYMWLTSHLRAAGLLYTIPDDWLERYRRAQLEAQSQVLEQEKEASARDADAAKRKTRKPKWSVPIELLPPPRCVTGAAKLDPKPPRIKEMNESARCYRLGETDDVLSVYGVTADEPTRLKSPILVGSLNPKRAELHFDARIHGWDGEFSEPVPEKSLSQRRLTQLICPKCQGRLFDTWAAFEPTEEEELPEEGGSPPAQDLFTWFWLVARCAACKWSAVVADVECA